MRGASSPLHVIAAAFAISAGVSNPHPFLAQTLSLSPRTMPAIGTVDERYQSYNIEMLEVTGGRFWAPYKTLSQPAQEAKPSAPGTMPASLYSYRPPVDLRDARLRKLAAALGPAYVRVSGTWANSTYFQDNDDPPLKTPPAGFNGVLTRSEWRSVIGFARAADARIVTSFAISPGVRDASGTWTTVEAEKVLRYTRRVGGNIAAAEMFNEPTFASMGGAPKGYDAEAYGRDFKAFHAFLKKADPSITILGPGSIGEAGSFGQLPGMHLLRTEDILKDEGPGLDAFSYHFYGAVSERCARMGAASAGIEPQATLSHDWLTRTERDEAFYAALRDRFTPGIPLWLTETAEAACGGDIWAGDFIDSFRYLNQLGILAKKGVKVVMHNTLNASDYALLDENTLTPRPDYWSALLWRRLMGTTVLDAGDSHNPNVYLYAHCLRGRPGGVALLAINADRASSFALTLPISSQRYTLTSNDLLSPSVELNGVRLDLTAAGDLPLLRSASQSRGRATLAPVSITFFTLPQAQNASCR